MKHINAIALFLASLVAAGHASAQDHVAQATIPFEFTVSGKLLPSGTYLISSGMDLHYVEIRNTQQRIAILSNVYASDAKAGNSELVFNKYGDQYFLSKILCLSAQMNVEIPTSKLEKSVRSQEARLHGAEQTMVALK
ncbi:hypothetical protein [Alloacidobacterium sp.]|uniref:hypothetical protein n=1 Tax=Alloacidobacterium sp. TaxID=2951999 RepID=UPI002D2C4176|nr:hypothetical protein [Alloacidobacterium sp.]HYK37809.1 hypothetical protein [Alloacidobacterium sp.]